MNSGAYYLGVVLSFALLASMIDYDREPLEVTLYLIASIVAAVGWPVAVIAVILSLPLTLIYFVPRYFAGERTDL